MGIIILGAFVLNTVFEQVMPTFGDFSGITPRAQGEGPRDLSDGGEWHERRHRCERVAFGALRRKFSAAVIKTISKPTLENAFKTR